MKNLIIKPENKEKCSGKYVYSKRLKLFLVIGIDSDKVFATNESGEIIKVIDAEPGLKLAYFTDHCDLDVAIVGGYDRMVNNWYDWHFGISNKFILFRHCPSY